MNVKLKAFTAVLVLLTVTAWSCNTVTWLALAEQDLPVLTTESVNILNLVDPSGADAALATKISNTTQAALKGVSDAVAAYNANPSATTLQKVQAALEGASGDILNVLNSLSGQFSNPTDLAIITAAVDAIVVTLDLISNQISPTPATRARLTKKGKSGTEKIPTPAQLKASWNKDVCGIAPGHCPKL